jgi:hypothetical protein
MSAVHFQGIKGVVEAYRYNQVAAWAIVCGREMPFTYEAKDIEQGSAMLEECMKMLMPEGSGDYVLRVYKKVPPGGIVSNTPYSNSFRFRLLTNEEYDARHGGAAQMGMIMARMDALEKRLFGDSDGDDEPEDTSLMGRISGMLSTPQVQQAIMSRVFGFIDRWTSPSRAAAVAGMGAADPGAEAAAGNEQHYEQTSADLYNALDAEERALFDQACHVLLKGDPQLGTNLTKLAHILETDPAKYKMLCKMA